MYIVTSYVLLFFFEMLHRKTQPSFASISTYFDNSHYPAAINKLTLSDLDNPKDYLVVHTDSDLCATKPQNFHLPKGTFNIAIMLRDGGCSVHRKGQNIMKWYAGENPNVKSVFLYDAQLVEDKNSKDTGTESLFVMTGMNIDADIPLSVLKVPSESAMSMIELLTKDSSGDGETESLRVQLQDHVTTGPSLAVQISVSVFVTIISLLITVALLMKIWGPTVSIEISLQGIVISQLQGDDDTPDPAKLMTKEQVLDFAEIQYGVDEDIEMQTSDKKSKCAISCKGNSTCSICLEDFENGETVRVLDCGHMYHTDCIVPWLTTRHASCPLCKFSYEEKCVEKKDC